MANFRVIAVFTRNEDFERREVEEFDSVTAAFERFGYYASRSNGVIVLDDQDNVWGEHTPSQIERPTHEQFQRYHLFMDRAAEPFGDGETVSA